MKWRHFKIWLAFFCMIVVLPSVAFGADVKLSWDPNSETDLAGYNIYWGSTSGNYSNSVDVGNVTTYQLIGLDEGQSVFAVTAYDINANESDFSDEVCAVLDTIPPTAISNLRKSGWWLKWTMPTDPDIIGVSLLWGTAPGEYTNSIEIGYVEEYDLHSFPEGSGEYYVAVATYDSGSWLCDGSKQVGPYNLAISNEVGIVVDLDKPAPPKNFRIIAVIELLLFDD